MRQIKFLKLIAVIIISIISSSCSGATDEPNELNTPDITSSPEITMPDFPSPTKTSPQVGPIHQKPPEINSGLTHILPNGNRVISGSGDLSSYSQVDVNLPGIPIWIVGVSSQSGIIWTVSLENGSVLSFFSNDRGISEYKNSISGVSPGAPVHTLSLDNQFSILTVSDPEQSTFTHPIYLPKSNTRAYISQNGDIIIIDAEDQVITILAVKALPDARLLVDEQDRILLISDPTDMYSHGVLGDGLEAKSITLINTFPTIGVSSRIILEDHEVIEGIAPIWADITGDGISDIIVTVSDQDLGAGIVVFDESGERLAEGPKMGQPFRWRHQIAIASSGPIGESELIVVRTPHIGGVIEYYQFDQGELKIVADFAGITSHIIGSRNLDMAAAGDFDGDGTIEVMLPTRDLSELVAIRRSPSGVEEIWKLPIGGVLSTNLSGARFPDGRIAIAIGRSDGVLRFWLPK